jgi:competence protein ComFC
MEMLRAAGEFAVDLVYPKRCAGCGCRGSWLCAVCDGELPRFAPPWCLRCGVPSALGSCQCEKMSTALSVTRSVGPFEGWLKNAILHCKYQGEWARAEPLADALAGAVADIASCDAVVPVPLHPARFRQRGFNQSQLLARQLTRLSGIHIMEPLARSRHTSAQATLPAESRLSNVAGAFALTRGANVEGLSLLLIDDVITTGATLVTCAEVLLKAGAKSVSAATLAREL